MPVWHPLDHAAWSALQGRHAHFALKRDGVLRYDPAYGVFAAIENRSDATFASLAALVAEYGDVAFLGGHPPAGIPGLTVASQDAGVQMTATRLTAAKDADFQIQALGEADAADMLSLATLTRPGPFFEHTHRLGDFFGVKVDRHLVAMAGERMKPDGFTEVSGVCTHPAFRGRGYAEALMRLVSQRVFDRGETPFLHAYVSNKSAIALYERLGFTLRRNVMMTRLTMAP